MMLLYGMIPYDISICFPLSAAAFSQGAPQELVLSGGGENMKMISPKGMKEDTPGHT